MSKIILFKEDKIRSYFIVLVFIFTVFFKGGVYSYYYLADFTLILAGYLYFFNLKPLYYSSYKKFSTNLDKPLSYFLIYLILLLIFGFTRELYFKDVLNEFYELWIKLGVLEVKPNFSCYSFNYWTAIISTVNIIALYMFFYLVLNTRKYLKNIYFGLYVFYNLVLVYSFYILFEKSESLFLVNHNHLASYISVPLPLIFYFYFMRGNKDDIWLKTIKMFHVLFILFVLFLTKSRSGMFSVFLVFSLYFYKERRKINFKIKFIVISAIVVLGIILLFSKGIYDSGILFSRQIKGSVNFNLRMEILSNSFKIFKENFLFGIGQGQFAIIYPYYAKGNETVFVHHLHNEYFQALLEYGFTGFALLVYVYLELIKFIRFALGKLKGRSKHLFIATVYSMLIFHIQIFFSFQGHIGVLALLYVFLTATLYIIVYNFFKFSGKNSEELL